MGWSFIEYSESVFLIYHDANGIKIYTCSREEGYGITGIPEKLKLQCALLS